MVCPSYKQASSPLLHRQCVVNSTSRLRFMITTTKVLIIYLSFELVSMVSTNSLIFNCIFADKFIRLTKDYFLINILFTFQISAGQLNWKNQKTIFQTIPDDRPSTAPQCASFNQNCGKIVLRDSVIATTKERSTSSFCLFSKHPLKWTLQFNSVCSGCFFHIRVYNHPT